MASCVMPYLFPACANRTSLLTTVFLVSSATNKCYEPDFEPGCTMPVLADHPDLYPVFNNITARNGMGLSGERVVTAKSGQLPQDARHIFINTTLGSYTAITPGMTISGAHPGVVVDALAVEAPNIKITDLIVRNLTFKTGINYKSILLDNVEVFAPVSLSPSPRQDVMDLDGAVFSNITGASIALFRHTGTVECSGIFTRCFVLEKNDPGAVQGIVHAEDGATVVNVSAITAIYGNPYLISFFAFNKEEELIQADKLAKALVWPTVIALLSILLAHGRPKLIEEKD